MKPHNVVFVVVSAIVGLTAAMAAQEAVSRGSKAPAKVEAKSVAITGCVAQGVDADHYMLTNAVRRELPPASLAEAGTSKDVASDKAGANDRTGSYDLEGGEFKARLGQKVEVTVTSGTTSGTSGMTASERTEERLPLPKLNIVSVKMLAATCS